MALSPQRWLVTGACGQLGGHVTARLSRQGTSVLGLGRRQCAGDHGPVRSVDVRRDDVLTDVLCEFNPTHIVHLASVSSPVEADGDPARAWSLNVNITRRLAEHAARTGGWLLYPSSDFVWDGTAGGRYRELDTPHPDTVYGRTKVAGERAVLDRGAGVVARFSLMYGMPVCPRESTWVRIAAAIRRGETISTCVDEFRTPLSFTDSARIVVELGARDIRGLLHVAGPDILTPREMITRFAGSLGVRPHVRPIRQRELGGTISRPRNVAMDASLLNGMLPELRPRPMSAASAPAVATVAGDGA